MTEQDYEILDNDDRSQQTQWYANLDVKTRRRDLWIILILSFGVDWIATSLALLLSPIFPVATIVIEEFIENVISNLIAKYGLKQDLSTWDNILGFIPFPGVTALTVRCVKELYRTYFPAKR